MIENYKSGKDVEERDSDLSHFSIQAVFKHSTCQR